MPNLLNPLTTKFSLPAPSINDSILTGKIDGTLTWIDQNTLLNKPIDNVIYVTKNGNDINNGKSLVFAKKTIKSALNSAKSGTTIIISSGYYEEYTPLICPPDVTITTQDLVQIKPINNSSDVFYLNSGTIINGVTVINHQGDSVAFKLLTNATIIKSPVIKNCSIISTNNSGNGIIIDGLAFNVNSTENSIIVENCNILVANKIGILAKNSGYAYITNCSTKFCDIGYSCESGGTLILNSCINFYGNYGLQSTGFNTIALDTGIIMQDEGSSISNINIDPTLYLFETPPTISIDAPVPLPFVQEWIPNTEIELVDLSDFYLSYNNNLYKVISSGITGNTPPVHRRGTELNGTCLFQYIGSTATAIPIMNDGFVVGIEVTDPGGGYITTPTVYFNNSPVTVSVELSHVKQIKVSNLNKQPLANNLIDVNNQKSQIYFATELDKGISDISVISNLSNVTIGSLVTFYESSKIIAINHQFNYVGSGTDTNALPKNNGYSNVNSQIIKSNFGSVHYSSNDIYSGISKIGDIFSVNQITGEITTTSTIESLINIGAIGPLIRNGVPVGVPVKEISSNDQLISSTGAIDSFTVPTQTAIYNYLNNNYFSLSGGTIIGSTDIQDINITNNIISSINDDQNIILAPNGNGAIDVATSIIINLAAPINDNDAVNKKFVVDLIQGGVAPPSIIPIIWGSTQDNGTLTLRSTQSLIKPLAGVILDDKIPSTSVDTGTLVVDGGVGISGALNATTKSFDIEHPLDSNKRLRYGSLESPYHGIRLTGRGIVVNGECTVKLPDYIYKLAKDEDVNVQLTNIRHNQIIWVDFIDIKNNRFVVKTDEYSKGYQFFWSLTAIRNDVDELIVEYTQT